MLVCFSGVIETSLYSESPNIVFLTICFTIFYFLAATQDIAVDAWALSLLSEKNKRWASTCNVIGQTLGIHFAYRFLAPFIHTQQFRVFSIEQPFFSLPFPQRRCQHRAPHDSPQLLRPLGHHLHRLHHFFVLFCPRRAPKTRSIFQNFRVFRVFGSF